MRKTSLLYMIVFLSIIWTSVFRYIVKDQGTPIVSQSLESVAEPLLEVQELHVEPTVVRSGTSIQVKAIVVNHGTAPAYNLHLGVAIGYIKATNGSWSPLTKQPSEPIKSLLPGEQVDFWGVIQVEGNGLFLVGIAGTATNTMLLPRGQKVWVVNPATFSSRAIMLYAFYVILLGIAGMAIWLLIGHEKGKLIFAFHYPLIGFGLSLMGMSLLWFVISQCFMPRIQPQISSWLPLGGVGLFIAGWMFVGAGLGPQAKAWRGIILAAIMYILIGIIWITAFNVGLGAKLDEVLLEPNFLLVALVWPLQVAQALGIFGLRFN